MAETHGVAPRALTSGAVIVAAILALSAPIAAAGDDGTPGAALILSPSGIPLVLVGGGSYLQGDTTGGGYPDEYPTRRVTVASFYLSTAEVTLSQYDQFCDETRKAKPSDNGWGRATRPAIYVSWLDAVEYCNWLSQKEGLTPFYATQGQSVTMDWTAGGYRLPTEAEWEYAARGGAAEGEATAEGLAAVAWYAANAGGRTHPIGEKSPNALGLYDMGGNVWEWCNDWYAPYPAGAAEDPRGPDQGQYRVLRGGSWYDAHAQRASARTRHLPTMRLPMLGFRVARSAPSGS